MNNTYMKPILNNFKVEDIKETIQELKQLDKDVIIAFEYELERNEYCSLYYDIELNRFVVSDIEEGLFCNPSIKYIDYRFYSKREFLKMEYKTSEVYEQFLKDAEKL